VWKLFKSFKRLRNMKNSKSLVGVLMAGAAIGIAIGILLAPSAGDKTRQKIVDGSMKVKDDLLHTVNDSVEALRRQFNSKIDQLSKTGKEVVNNTTEKVKV
jgi:gas vesicle protein